jgi:hypothetical protein
MFLIKPIRILRQIWIESKFILDMILVLQEALHEMRIIEYIFPIDKIRLWEWMWLSFFGVAITKELFNNGATRLL